MKENEMVSKILRTILELHSELDPVDLPKSMSDRELAQAIRDCCGWTIIYPTGFQMELDDFWEECEDKEVNREEVNKKVLGLLDSIYSNI